MIQSIYSSMAAKRWPGYDPGSSYKLPGPLWFSFDRNLLNPKWVGNLAKVPEPMKIIICGETNHLGRVMHPQENAIFTNNVQTRYRVSRPRKTLSIRCWMVLSKYSKANAAKPAVPPIRAKGILGNGGESQAPVLFSHQFLTVRHRGELPRSTHHHTPTFPSPVYHRALNRSEFK